ncbi:MAG: tetratricopeptide repeat protein [bacterium]|nr:tetratricopeptide repeat protein [bacterium]
MAAMMNRTNRNVNVTFMGIFALTGVLMLAAAPVAHADVVVKEKSQIEGRILENSAKVIVIESIKGEYLVLDKSEIKSIQNEPEEEFYYRRGEYYLSKGDDQLALLDFMETLRRNPNHQGAQQERDAIFHQRKQEVWNQNLEKANQQIASQNYRQALASFQRVLEMDPEDQLAQDVVKQMSDVYTRIAFQYFNHCYEEDAIVELTKAEELNPNSAEIYYVLARIHHHARNYEQARLEYERALEINPNHTGARTHLNELVESANGRFYR